MVCKKWLATNVLRPKLVKFSSFYVASGEVPKSFQHIFYLVFMVSKNNFLRHFKKFMQYSGLAYQKYLESLVSEISYNFGNKDLLFIFEIRFS